MMIRIWVYDGVLASGVAGAIDVFHAANSVKLEGSDSPKLHWRVESLDGQPVRAASGQTIAVDGKIAARGHGDIILLTAPFVGDMEAFIAQRERILAISRALQSRHADGALLAAYCTGSYLLAEAGLLDGRIATTHWNKAADFARRYPRVELRANEVLTEQDGILCGGAVTSCLTLAVRLVEHCLGTARAVKTARLLLIDTQRIAQSAYATLVAENEHADRLVARAQQRMQNTLPQRFSLPDLAAHLAVSERTLNRHFKQATGLSPLGYLQTLRVEVAKRLLESGHLSLAAIGQRIGYHDLSTFRQLFKRKTGLSPRAYQQRFALSPPASR